jgi:predicted ATPase/DNA-binding SARP family transcriptional activator
VRYTILGSTQALRDDGTPVALAGGRLRALLTALALRPGRVVGADLLIGEVWDGEPPAGATGALQALVGRLRRAVGHEAVGSVEGGYRLEAAREDVDLYRFERLAEEGARALADGDPVKAAGLLGDALALWRGPALADLPDRGTAAVRSEALRLDARRQRLTAELALGRGDRILPELAELAAAHPLDEPMRALHIRALRATGRTADALTVYESVRRELADQLGTDPSPELRRLHAELLNPAPWQATSADAEPPRAGGSGGHATPGGQADAARASASGAAASVSATDGDTDRSAGRGDAGRAPGADSGRGAEPAYDRAGTAVASRRGTAGPTGPGNRRARLTSFVGRESELGAVRQDLARGRLVTITGPGGTGKTRLSQEAGDLMAGHWADGVWYVELAPVSDPRTLPEAVISSLGLRETLLHSGSAAEAAIAAEAKPRDPAQQLIDYCASRELLLVLDNCEHVIDAAASLAEQLLASCPGLSVLATSREPLGVPGELVRPLDPLPDPTALRLLADRGTAARPGFSVEEDPGACAELCRRLDGLPLAIELAAARLRSLSPRQLADRLDDRFRLLTGGSRTLLPRQQTLRAVVDWSWDLLDPPERVLLRRLAVFHGGWTLEAVESVSADPPPADGHGSARGAPAFPASDADRSSHGAPTPAGGGSAYGVPGAPARGAGRPPHGAPAGGRPGTPADRDSRFPYDTSAPADGGSVHGDPAARGDHAPGDGRSPSGAPADGSPGASADRDGRSAYGAPAPADRDPGAPGDGGRPSPYGTSAPGGASGAPGRGDGLPASGGPAGGRPVHGDPAARGDHAPGDSRSPYGPPAPADGSPGAPGRPVYGDPAAPGRAPGEGRSSDGGPEGVRIPVGEAAALLASLVDKSLVLAELTQDGPRYRMLETISEYAAERLDAAGERGVVERRHVAYFREYARTADPRLRGAGQLVWFERLEREHENLRAALRRAVAARDEQEALMLVLGCAWFWEVRNYSSERRYWPIEVAALGPDPFDTPPSLVPVERGPLEEPLPLEGERLLEARRHVRVIELSSREGESEWWIDPTMNRLGVALIDAYPPHLPQSARFPGIMRPYGAFFSGDFDRLYELIDETVDSCRTHGRTWELAYSLQLRAKINNDATERLAACVRDIGESRRLFQQLGDEWGTAETLSAEAEAAANAGDWQRTVRCCHEGIALARKIGSHQHVPVLTVRLGDAMVNAGEPEEGERLLREGIKDAQRFAAASDGAAFFGKVLLAQVLARRDDIAEALAVIEEAITEGAGVSAGVPSFVLGMLNAMRGYLIGRSGDPVAGMALFSDGIVELSRHPLANVITPRLAILLVPSAVELLVLLADAQPEARSARLLRAVALLNAHDRLRPTAVPPAEARDIETVRARLRADLGEKDFVAAYAEGDGLSLEEAVALMRDAV